MFLDARRLQQEHKGSRAAVHDRYFARADFNQRIVYPQARERGQQVFDRGNFDLAAMKRGAHRRVADIFGVRTDVDRVIQIRAAKHNAGVRQRRPQGHQNLLTRMQPNPGGTNRVLQCSLIQH